LKSKLLRVLPEAARLAQSLPAGLALVLHGFADNGHELALVLPGFADNGHELALVLPGFADNGHELA
jgi:hypothetical protein